MALCAARAQELGGGLVVARDGEVRGELALPIAGLLSDAPLEEVAEGLEGLQDLLREQGVEIGAPFMTLSFLALSVIPSLKITDRGLVDVDAFRLVPLAARAASVTRSWRASARSTSTRRGSPSARGGRSSRTSRRSTRALRDAMYAASEDEQLALIRAHPDLGERVARADRALAARAGRRWGSIGSPPPSTSASWRPTPPTARSSASRSWSACASTAKDSILANADARLGNAREQEIATALGEIAKIARLRLEDAL